MKLHTLPVTAGKQWITLAWRIFRQKPLLFLGISALGLMLPIFLGYIPMLGAAVGLMAQIYISLIFLVATHEVTLNNTPTLNEMVRQILKTPSGKRPLVVLSIFYATAFLAALILSSYAAQWLVPEAIANMTALSARVQEVSNYQASQDDMVVQAQYYIVKMGTTFAAYSMVFIFFFFAPALVYWKHITPAKAVFFTLMTTLKNIRTFVVYGLIWLVLLLLGAAALSLVLTALLLLLGVGEAGIVVASLMSVIYSLMVFALLQIATYFAFKECFGVSETEEQPAPPVSSAPF